LDHIINALTAVEPLDRLHRVFVADIDDMIGPEFAPNRKPVVAGAGKNNGLRPQGLRHRHAEKTDRPGTGDDHTLAGNQTAAHGESVPRSVRGRQQRRLVLRHRVGNGDESVDVVDLIFAEAAVGSETIGAMSLVDIAVVETVVMAGGVHAFAAALALAAAGMNFDSHALADLVFVDARTECDDRAHIFVTWRRIP